MKQITKERERESYFDEISSSKKANQLATEVTFFVVLVKHVIA